MSTKLESKIRSKTFVITAEIVPPLAGGAAPLLAEAHHLREGVDAINVTDAAAGRTTMASFASAAILAQNGYEPILQVTCRDRNRIALAGDLLGAAAQGVHNVLVLRGDDEVRTAIAFDNGDPAVVEGRLGRGRVIVFATAASPGSSENVTSSAYRGTPAFCSTVQTSFAALGVPSALRSVV